MFHLMKSLFFFSILVILGCTTSVRSETFVTWEGLEPDKVASMWLIKRFVDPQATFSFIEKGSPVDGAGVPFDIPQAELRRHHTRSTFETILFHYKLQDEKLNHLAELIHDIEINTWMKDRKAESVELEQNLWKRIGSQSSSESVFSKILLFLDRYYASINNSAIESIE